jgi:hypothetical protein
MASCQTAHLQVIGGKGNRRWRAFSWDADGKHSPVLGPAWAQNSGKRTPRGAIVWHAADGPKPDQSYSTLKEAQAELRRLLEHEVARHPAPLTSTGTPVTFGDAAEAWLLHGERKRKRNLKRSTLADYRQVLDAYLLPAPEERHSQETIFARAPFAATSLRDLNAAQVETWYDRLPYGHTAGRELLVVLASLQQWGDAHVPWPAGPTVVRRARNSGRPLHVGFIDDRGREISSKDAVFVRTSAYPTGQKDDPID